MSQRQSDISSLGGYSNVETGSQPDSDTNQQRRGSLTSNLSEPLSVPAENAPKTESEVFSRSVDVLSGSSETLISVLLKTNADKQNEQKPTDAQETINSTNSISMLHKPFDKVGFVTLDALMRGDGDIGRMLNRSIESIEKGIIPTGASPLQKQSSNDSQSRGSSGAGQRERRDSTFSLDTGSDSEKKSVSMKYMGTLPEGTNYESFVKQVSQENKNKSLMFTFSSPEAMSRLRAPPDAGSTPVLKPSDGCVGVEPGYKSDGSSQTNSTRTLTHMSDMESQSVISTYSLGEQIKRLCDGHKSDETMDIETPRTAPDDNVGHTAEATGISENSDSVVKFDGMLLSDIRNSPVKDCYIKLEQLDTHVNRSSPKTVTLDNCSPIRKRLKSKKERDQKSRRKQKESFILLSDTNSSGENESKSVIKVECLPSRLSAKCEEDLVLTGSEDRTPRPSETQEAKRSLLDEVQLETETPSDSCEDRSQSAGQKQRYFSY